MVSEAGGGRWPGLVVLIAAVGLIVAGTVFNLLVTAHQYEQLLQVVLPAETISRLADVSVFVCAVCVCMCVCLCVCV